MLTYEDLLDLHFVASKTEFVSSTTLDRLTTKIASVRRERLHSIDAHLKQLTEAMTRMEERHSTLGELIVRNSAKQQELRNERRELTGLPF